MSCLAVYSGMTINPRFPTIPGRSMSGFHRPCRHCLHQARSAVRCSANRMRGALHPTKKRLWSGFSCIWMTASSELPFGRGDTGGCELTDALRPKDILLIYQSNIRLHLKTKNIILGVEKTYFLHLLVELPCDAIPVPQKARMSVLSTSQI